jgi:hypothetical protein
VLQLGLSQRNKAKSVVQLHFQAYGMMGWRCGYIAFPTPEAGAPANLGAQLTKVQDTIPICASQVTPSCTSTPVPNEGIAPAKQRVLMSRITRSH